MPSSFAIDRQDISRHLRLLFQDLEGFAAIRIFPEKGMQGGRRETPFVAIGPGLVAAVHSYAEAAAQSGRAIYVVPGTVAKRGSAKVSDILATAVVLVDLDEGDIDAKFAHLVEHLGQPTIEVASGGITADGQPKRHLYWRLDEPAAGDDLRLACRIRAELAAKVGADPAFASAHQPIRLAGSIHNKNQKPSEVRIIGESDARSRIVDFAKVVANMPPLAGSGPAGLLQRKTHRQSPKPTELMTLPVREHGIDGITRFGAISSVMGHWIRQQRLGHVDADEAWKAITEHNTALICPPWEDTRLRSEYEALLRVDRANHPSRVREDDADETSESNADLSDDALARVFTAKHGRDWRYVSPWGQWLRWTGKHWRVDEVGEVFELVRRTCRGTLKPDATNAERRRVKSNKTIRAVEQIIRNDPEHSTLTEAWDADLHILNTPNGLIDLRTGEHLPHAREAMITRVTQASPQGDCPLWVAFVTEIANGDLAVTRYLARVAGYCLSGDTSEQAFFFLHGAGANGKSVFISVISDVLGDYAATAPLDTFMASRGDRHPTDLAGLRGARLVSVNETEAGRSWSEARIKAITGGDKLRVRLMHKDFFEFTPVFKLMVAGNHRPRLENVGEAMRRRLHLVPFEVTIPAERRDKNLVEKLRAERDGILGWMLEGHAEWQRIGLVPPDTILEAGSAYFDDEDIVGQWIAEACIVGSTLWAQSASLYASFKEWAAARGLEPGSQRGLGEALRQHGFTDDRTARARIWRGIALRAGKAASHREAVE